jgi:FKBP-type peptidyl-prolyl cis-trans isomerase FklB
VSQSIIFAKILIKKINMKIKGLIALTLAIALVAGSCGLNSVKSAKLKTENDTLSYAIAANIYKQLAMDSITLNPAMVAKALIDSKEGNTLMTEEQINAFMQVYMTRMQKAQAEEQAAVNKVTFKDWINLNQDFLAKNKVKSGVTVTPSGLQYEVIQMGTGPKPTKESTVKVHYVGTLVDGTEFDSSVKRNEPAQFPVTGVIRGWTEALQLMPVGSKFKIYLPDSLAYGANQASEIIKPYSTLIFEVELLEIVQ